MSMMDKIFEEFLKSEKLKVIDDFGGIKDFMRPEELASNASSVVIIPLTSPEQDSFASDVPLRKKFLFQINVETADYDETKLIAREVEKAMLALSFFQQSGGLDEYFEETGRYVDARTYRGFSDIYDLDY